MNGRSDYPVVPPGHEYVVFDLDGTLAMDTFPSPWIGDVIPEGEAMLHHYHRQGYAIVVYTARPASHAIRIWDWLSIHGLDAKVYDVVTNKPLAGLYIDDRGYRFE